MDLKILIKNATPEELAALINALQNYNTIDSDTVVETPVKPLVGEQEKPKRTRSGKKEAEPVVVAEQVTDVAPEAEEAQVDIFGQTEPDPIVVETRVPGVVYAEIGESLSDMMKNDKAKFSVASGLLRSKYACSTLKDLPEARYEEFLAEIKAL